MPSGLETQSLAVDPSVSPVVLAVMFIAFLVGAVGPFALCVLGSIRDERAMRRLAANARAEAPLTVDNPVDPVIVPAVLVMPEPAAMDAGPLDAANDDGAVAPVRQRTGAGG